MKSKQQATSKRSCSSPCPLCNAKVRRLMKHLTNTHKLSAEEAAHHMSHPATSPPTLPRQKLAKLPCKSPCPLCNVTVERLRKHLINTHKLSGEEADKHMIPASEHATQAPSSPRQAMTKLSCSSPCPLCNTKVTRLRKHLKNKHKLSDEEASRHMMVPKVEQPTSPQPGTS